jgi:putative SOS response-associated peptidase YedK
VERWGKGVNPGDFNSQYQPRFNVGPMQYLHAIIPNAVLSHPLAPGVIAALEEERSITAFRWGLVPHWAKDEERAANAINARSETVTELPTFKGAFKYRRCLIPVNGFYEWDRKGKEKVPYYFRRADEEPLMFAGLWDLNNATGDPLYSCATLTADANTLMAPIHHRMPVLLTEEDQAVWLDPKTTLYALHSLLLPSEWEGIEAYPVTPRMGNVQYQEPDCIEPLKTPKVSLVKAPSGLWDE